MVEIEDCGLQVRKGGAGEESAPSCSTAIMAARDLTTRRAAGAQGNRYPPDHGQLTAREQPRREEVGAHEAAELDDPCGQEGFVAFAFDAFGCAAECRYRMVGVANFVVVVGVPESPFLEEGVVERDGVFE